MIGGIEIELRSPANDAIPDLIVRQMVELWPGARFQDAYTAEVRSIGDPWVAIFGTCNLEFFVFRDAAAAEKWQAAGAVQDNSNTMLHFIVENPAEAKSSTQLVTLVCDEETAEISRLIDGLRIAFHALAPNP